MAAFTLDYWTDDGWYVGKLREVPGIFSQGKTLDELKLDIKDALAIGAGGARLVRLIFRQLDIRRP